MLTAKTDQTGRIGGIFVSFFIRKTEILVNTSICKVWIWLRGQFVSFIQILKNSTLLVVVVKLCTYHVFPQREMAGIPWGLDCQNSHCPREFDRRLWHTGVFLDASARKSRRNYVYIWRHAQGILDTKLRHMGSELDPIFQNCLIPWGNPDLHPLGKKHW